MNTDFQLKILATNWGFQARLDAYCAKVKQEGYDGIEIWCTGSQIKLTEIVCSIKKI